MVGLHKMESKRYGTCAFCNQPASTICDKTRNRICPSCVTIRIISAGRIEIRGVKK